MSGLIGAAGGGGGCWGMIWSCIHPTPRRHLPKISPIPPHPFLFHRTVPPRPLFQSVPRTVSRPPLVVASTPPLLQDAAATTALFSSAYFLVLAFDKLTESRIIRQSLSRKLVHILSGLLFAASWPFFSDSVHARYFAALVPLANFFRLLIHGLSLAADDTLVTSLTREGNPKELLRGPLYYVVVLLVSTTVFWRESPVGVVSVAMMCGGDGIADIIGRRYGFQKLPYNPHKSWLGSISMFICGSLISAGMLYCFTSLGCFSLDWSSALQRVLLVSLVATIVESLPITETLDDNLSVPLASMVTALMIFG
uniref:phytol kinase n=1 Tax=Kalanchoe fedtschenkoi TaxID=63787 RepID=A0A7N0U622_KALFE